MGVVGVVGVAAQLYYRFHEIDNEVTIGSCLGTQPAVLRLVAHDHALTTAALRESLGRDAESMRNSVDGSSK